MNEAAESAAMGGPDETDIAGDAPLSAVDEELRRTAFQKKVVTRLPPAEALDRAIAFFRERGYRAGRTGRPNQVFIFGKGEGALPRVTGEVMARGDVGKPGTTLVTLDAAGERLGPAMAEFAKVVRVRATPERR
ncbi:MAG TPA: hypothetical protein VFX03_08615 [Thermomicrobiales bacterium]|nr:hypothetical protein [Thermomicrobiales bacterium]